MKHVMLAAISALLILAVCSGCAKDSAMAERKDQPAGDEERPQVTAAPAQRLEPADPEKLRQIGYAAAPGEGTSGEGAHAEAARRAVGEALAWLVRHQDSGGFWDADGFAAKCEPEKQPCPGKGQPLNDVGVTGLALLALLADGNTPIAGRYREAVKEGVKYLCDVQDPADGCMVPKEGTHYMYNHAIGTLALCECYGLSNMPILKKYAQMALDFVHASKNPGRAWRYNLGEANPALQNDTSVTGWMVLCLASGHKHGLQIHADDLRDALNFINDMTDSETGRTGYNRPGAGSSREAGDEVIWPFDQTEATTALAMICRHHAGKILGTMGQEEAPLDAASALLLARPPEWDMQKGCIDYYYWFFGTLAMERQAGAGWHAWKDDLVAAVLDNQIKEGCARGSWDSQKDPWGDNGGRVYSTALLAMCLECY